MKKIILTLFVGLFTVMVANAATYNPETKVSTVGSTIISKNALPSVKFAVVEADADNSNVTSTKLLNVSKTDLQYTGNDNEVAAVVAKELGAIVNSAASTKSLVTAVSNSVLSNITDEKLKNVANLTQQISINHMSSKDQMNADITGVDLMINAGYNPLAIIVMDTKMMSQFRYDIFGTHPLSSRRVMQVYEYIYEKYPAFLANNKYADNLYYQNFLLTSEKNRQQLEEKIIKLQIVILKL